MESRREGWRWKRQEARSAIDRAGTNGARMISFPITDRSPGIIIFSSSYGKRRVRASREKERKKEVRARRCREAVV